MGVDIIRLVRLASTWEEKLKSHADSERLARRLATAIPLRTEPSSVCSPPVPEPEIQSLQEPAADSSAVTLGVLTSAVVCAGCLIKRYYRAIKSTFTQPRRTSEPHGVINHQKTR